MAGITRACFAAGATIVALLTAGTYSAAGAPLPDPDLEPGFPVQTYESAGSYHGGPANHTLVGNIA
jgi:hypothetical protein